MHGDISALALLLYFTVLEKLKLEKVPIHYFFGKYSCFISLKCSLFIAILFYKIANLVSANSKPTPNSEKQTNFLE